MYVCMYVWTYVCGLAVLGCSLRPHWRFFMIFFVPFRGKILGVRRKITLSRRRSRGEEEEEVGNKEKKLVRELCLLEEEEEEEEQLTEVQHSSVCLLERSTQQQQRVLDYAVLVFSLL